MRQVHAPQLPARHHVNAKPSTAVHSSAQPTIRRPSVLQPPLRSRCRWARCWLWVRLLWPSASCCPCCSAASTLPASRARSRRSALLLKFGAQHGIWAAATAHLIAPPCDTSTHVLVLAGCQTIGPGPRADPNLGHVQRTVLASSAPRPIPKQAVMSLKGWLPRCLAMCVVPTLWPNKVHYMQVY